MQNAQLHYSQEGRAGTVHYCSPETSFDMWFEFAGGGAVAIINIPPPQYWESQTQIPLSQRDATLQFIGERVIRDQLGGNGYFREDDNFITIYSGRDPDAA